MMSGLNSIYEQQAKRQKITRNWGSLLPTTAPTVAPVAANPTSLPKPRDSPAGRVYPEPTFECMDASTKKTGQTGRSSYEISFKLNAIAYARVMCADGKAVGNRGAANRLGVSVKRIREWVKDEQAMKDALSSGVLTTKARSMGGGRKSSTAHLEQDIVDYINLLRKRHLAVNHDVVMSKLLSLDPTALGGLPSATDPTGLDKFREKFRSWYLRFKRRNGLSIGRMGMEEKSSSG